jgi:hypothetical protein
LAWDIPVAVAVILARVRAVVVALVVVVAVAVAVAVVVAVAVIRAVVRGREVAVAVMAMGPRETSRKKKCCTSLYTRRQKQVLN